ncbi:MAG: nickel pincer cofactor biosynthesis protein LarC [Planctomycetaceae bacterium]|nr:nickel pincer cofactor biosynthesis protein LarC [Planctomycetaceae bacterium]
MTNIAYLDCSSGISGDMTLAALVDAGVGLDALNVAVGSLGLPGLHLRAEECRKQGFRAVQVHVDCPPEHKHRNLEDILALIAAGRLTARQREMAARIFTRLAQAEARVHGVPVEKVHFHEVGAADSIADIVGAAVGFDLLGVERIAASPVPTGVGKIRIAHGECSIPAPATAELLKGIPLAASSVEGELTTPTGAAILATLVDSFGPLPAMKIDRVGCGAGQKDFAGQPNILRLMVGDAVEPENRVRACTHAGCESDEVAVLETNLDDVSGEIVGYSISRLWDAGALDVYTTAIQMKKNRPAVKLTVLCRPKDATAMEAILFAETTTLGIRSWTAARHVLRREPQTVETPWGPVEGKVSYLPDGTRRFAPEYESCREVAEREHVALREVYEAARKAYGNNASFPRSRVGTHSPDAPAS